MFKPESMSSVGSARCRLAAEESGGTLGVVGWPIELRAGRLTIHHVQVIDEQRSGRAGAEDRREGFGLFADSFIWAMPSLANSHAVRFCEPLASNLLDGDPYLVFTATLSV